MADLEFNFDYVPNRYVDRVQRAAVLYPLTKKCRSVRQMRAQIAALQIMWRARVSALTNQGWVPHPGPNSIVFARNCLPTFAYTTPRTRPCGTPTVCPFCYARWVREIWMTVDQSFPNPKELNADDIFDGDVLDYDDTDEGLPQHGLFDGRELRTVQLGRDPPEQHAFKYHAVEYINQYTRDYPDDPAATQQFLARIHAELVAVRKAVIARIDPSAAFLYDTVAPAKTGWQIRVRHLLRVAPGQALPATYGAQTTAHVTRHERPTRKVLFGAVARVCRYPTLMIRGDPGLTAMLLALRQSQRFRMSAMYRGFRSHTHY